MTKEEREELLKRPVPAMPADQFTPEEEKQYAELEDWYDRCEQQLAQLQQQEREKKEAKKAKRDRTDPRTLRTPQAAKYLGISEWKLRMMVHDGEIPCIRGKYWTFGVQVLDAWIKQNQE